MAKKHSKINDFLAAQYVEFSQPESERLTALYADFSKLVFVNKFAYDTNINYWRRVILDCNLQGYLTSPDYSLVIDKESTTDAFYRPILGKPLAIETVMDFMEKEQELVAIENFESVFSNSSSWLSWIYDNVVKTTWQWRWRPLSDTLPHPPQQYVVVPTLKALAKAILDHHHQHATRATEDVLTLSQFKSVYGHHFMNQLELTEADIHLVLQYLHSQHGLAIQDQVKGYGAHYTILKFPSQASNQPAKITKHDEALINIRTTCQALSAQVDELQRQSEALTQASIQEKKQGHTAKALYCLKRKKNLQQILERRLKSMETMDTILLKIESSQDDLQIVQAFNTGADTLKSLLNDNGLSVESVDEAMSQLQYVLEDQKEIEDAMKMGMDDISAMDTDGVDIEDELSHLIQEEKEQPDISKAPSVPTTQPIRSELSRLNQMFSQPDSSCRRLVAETE